MSAPKPLLEKMLEIYKTVDFIPKNGYNKSQSYKFMRAADVVIELRKNLIAQRVYVEVNYTFWGPAYTIARDKAPNAPFSAVSVTCNLVFHDLDSAQTLTASGVGTGCDTNDKAGYKAMTGALKYALKNAFLVPDEADPEGDESVEETRNSERSPVREGSSIDLPDFQESKHEEAKAAAPRAARPTTAKASPKTGATAAATSPAPAPAGVPPANKPDQASLPISSQPRLTGLQNSESTTTDSSPASAQPSPAETREPGDESETVDTRMPNGEELALYRKLFQKLGDDLSTEGGLTQSPKLPIERKMLAFLLSITGANAAKEITNEQWKSFFARVEAGKNAEAVGLKGITVLINRVNGVQPKAAKAKK